MVSAVEALSNTSASESEHEVEREAHTQRPAANDAHGKAGSDAHRLKGWGEVRARARERERERERERGKRNAHGKAGSDAHRLKGHVQAPPLFYGPVMYGPVLQPVSSGQLDVGR